MLSRQTHLDQLADKLGEDRVRRVVEPLLSGAAADDSSARDIEYVRDLGLIARDDPPRIANPIYAEVVPRELTAALQAKLPQDTAWYVDRCGRTRPRENCWRRSRRSSASTRSTGWDASTTPRPDRRLILQAFLQRVVNGGGRIEREYGLGAGAGPTCSSCGPAVGRAGPAATADRFVVECKVLHGGLERTVREGLEQTAGYMDSLCGAGGPLGGLRPARRPAVGRRGSSGGGRRSATGPSRCGGRSGFRRDRAGTLRVSSTATVRGTQRPERTERTERTGETADRADRAPGSNPYNRSRSAARRRSQPFRRRAAAGSARGSDAPFVSAPFVSAPFISVPPPPRC